MGVVPRYVQLVPSTVCSTGTEKRVCPDFEASRWASHPLTIVAKVLYVLRQHV